MWYDNIIGDIRIKVHDSKELRKIQRQLLLKCILWTIPLFLLALLFLINIKYDFIFLICFILTCLIMFVPISMFNDKFSTLIIKNYILPYIKENFCKTISFDKVNSKSYKPDSKPLNYTLGTYFNSWEDINNVISGTINGINFKIADANTRTYFCGFPVTDFYGQIVEINHNTAFDNEIFIAPPKIYNRNFCSNYLLNKDFSVKKHVVYTKNNNIKYDQFQFIKIFIENYNKNMYVHINQNKMLIMIDSNNSLLNQFNLFYIKEYNCGKLYKIFDLIKSISEKDISL